MRYICENPKCEAANKPIQEQRFNIALEGKIIDGTGLHIDSWEIWDTYYNGGTLKAYCRFCGTTSFLENWKGDH